MIQKLQAKFVRNDTEQIISQGLFASLIIAAVVFAAYSIVLSSNFGVLDDYTFLYNAITGSNHTLTLLISAGRPLNAVLLDLGFHSAGSIENLAILRAITLFGIWLLGCGLYSFSRIHCVSFISSLAIACGIVLLPSFQVYASWAQHFSTPIAGAFALLSAFILTPACAMRERSRGLAIFLSVILLVIAILIYQPIAMLFCTGILISVLSKPDIFSDWKLSRAIDAATAFVTAMVLGLIIFKIGQYIYPSDSSRYGLVQNIPDKLGWFFSEPMVNALSLYIVPANITLQLVVVLTIFFGVLFLIKKCGFKTVSIILIYVILGVLGSYAPNLATAENWASYRSIGALGASVVVMLVLLVSGPIDYIQKRYATRILIGTSIKYFWFVMAIFLIILSGQVQSNVQNGFVLPNVTELNNLASLFNDVKIQHTEKVKVIIKPSSWADSAARPMAYDEFGMPSSVRDYYAKPIVEIVLRSMNSIPDAIITMAGDITTSQKADDANNLLVDFPRLVTSQRFKTDPSASLNLNPNAISPLNISDDNWKNGIWANKSNPTAYGFVYQSIIGDKVLKAGDKLKFKKSGFRTVLRVDVTGDYINVMVDGSPLHPEGDGYPRSIMRNFDTE